MADLAGAHLLVEHFQGFLQRCEALFLVLVAELAEEVGPPLRPVQLVEVQPVCLQALQAGIEGGDDVLAVELEVAVAHMLMPLPGPAILLARIQSARSLLRRNQLPMMRW